MCPGFPLQLRSEPAGWEDLQLEERWPVPATSFASGTPAGRTPEATDEDGRAASRPLRS